MPIAHWSSYCKRCCSCSCCKRKIVVLVLVVNVKNSCSCSCSCCKRKNSCSCSCSCSICKRKNSCSCSCKNSCSCCKGKSCCSCSCFKCKNSCCKDDVPIAHKSSGGHYIFAGCLFFEIRSSWADFLDLEQCHKPSSGHMTIASGRLFGHHPIFLPNGQNFRPMLQRPSSGLLAVTAGGPVDRRRTKMNSPITGHSPFDGWPVIGGGPTDVLLVQFATRVCNFQCL